MSAAETVLVTGGSGFVAQWCIIELLRRGFMVRATLRDASREAQVRAALAAQVAIEDRLRFVSAKLEADAGWAAAVDGCTYVLHVASPFPSAMPKDANTLIGPARDGTLRVLRNSVEAGVRRVVLTSSSSAMAYSGIARRTKIIDESCWTDPARAEVTPYAKSKTLAEQAAWNFMKTQGRATSLAVVAPNTVIGPVLSGDVSYSIQAISRLLQGAAPALPNFGFSYVDVRDIADLHLLAMTLPAAAGRRILGAGTFLWYPEVAQILRTNLGPAAGKVPKRVLPDWLVRWIAAFDPSLRPILSELGTRRVYSGEVARTLFGWAPRPVAESILDCANSLIRLGVVTP